MGHDSLYTIVTDTTFGSTKKTSSRSIENMYSRQVVIGNS